MTTIYGFDETIINFCENNDSSSLGPYAKQYMNELFRIIVSNRPKRTILATLDHHEIPRPDVLVSRDDVDYWKSLCDRVIFTPTVMVGNHWFDKEFAYLHKLDFISSTTL